MTKHKEIVLNELEKLKEQAQKMTQEHLTLQLRASMMPTQENVKAALDIDEKFTALNRRIANFQLLSNLNEN